MLHSSRPSSLATGGPGITESVSGCIPEVCFPQGIESCMMYVFIVCVIMLYDVELFVS